MGVHVAITFRSWSESALGSTEAVPTFLSFDQNLNGTVSADEFEIGLMREFDRMDENMDDSLSRSEMVFTIQERRQSRQSRGGEGLQENARTVGGKLLERLHDLKDKHMAIGDVRGHGLMLALEFVTDRDSKTPDKDMTTEVFEACRAQSIILSKSGPFQQCLRMVPPLCLSMDDVDQVTDSLDNALADAAQ